MDSRGGKLRRQQGQFVNTANVLLLRRDSLRGGGGRRKCRGELRPSSFVILLLRDYLDVEQGAGTRAGAARLERVSTASAFRTPSGCCSETDSALTPTCIVPWLTPDALSRIPASGTSYTASRRS